MFQASSVFACCYGMALRGNQTVNRHHFVSKLKSAYATVHSNLWLKWPTQQHRIMRAD